MTMVEAVKVDGSPVTRSHHQVCGECGRRSRAPSPNRSKRTSAIASADSVRLYARLARVVSRFGNPHTSQYHRPRISWLVVLFVVTCLAGQAVALTAEMTISTEIPIETLVIDTRTPVLEDGRWLILSPEELELRRLRKRDSPSSDLPVTTTAQAPPVSADGTSTPTTSTSTTAVNSPLPSPLDGSLSSNFTSGCASFINSFLADETFKQCYPFSILLSLPSQSFFNDEKSLVSISQVLDASCSANVTFCSNYFSNLAQNLTSSGNCGTDYDQGNSVVTETYISMIAYAPLYQASCLKDPQTSVYCYASAITNKTTPSNVYFYYLPLNTSLPGSTVPTCNACLQNTMNVYQATCANRKQPIASTYAMAAQEVNTICGPGFSNETLPEALVTSGAFSHLAAAPSGLLVALAVAWAATWLTT